MELKTEYSRTVNFGDDIDIIEQSLIFNNMDSCMGDNVHIKFNKLFMEIPFFLSCIFGNHFFEKDDNKICLNTKLFLEKVYLYTHNAHNFKEKLIDHIMDIYLPELNANIEENGLVVEYNKISKEEQQENVDITTKIPYSSKDFHKFDQELVIKYNKVLQSKLFTEFFTEYESTEHNPISNMDEIQHTYPDHEFFSPHPSLGKFNMNKEKLTSYVYPTITKLIQDLLLVYDKSLDLSLMAITYYTKGWFQFYIRKLEDYAKINTAALLYHTILNKILNKMTNNNHIFDAHSSSDINQKYFRILSQFSVFFKKLQSDSVETTPCNKLFFYVKENTFNEDNIHHRYKHKDENNQIINKIKQDIRYFNMYDEKLVYKDTKYPFSQEYIDKTLTISKDKGAFFTNEVEPQILSGLLSISNIIKNNENCVLFSFGYSGVGKTTNIFGGDEKTKNSSLMNMIMMNVKDTHDIEVNISDYYGIKLNEKEPNVFVMSFKKNTEITEITFNEVDPVFITIKNVDQLKTLTDGVDSIRKNKGHIVETSNNPNSSRSFIVYKFRFTQKQSKQANFLYVFDMPGVEHPSLDSESDFGSTPSTSHFNMLFQNSGGILEPIENIITNLYCDISSTESYSIPDIVERQSDKRITFNEKLLQNTTEEYNLKKNYKLFYLDIASDLLNIQFSMSDSTTMYLLEADNININYNDIYNKISLLFEDLSDQIRDQHIINYIVYDFNKKVQVSKFNSNPDINDDGIKTWLTDPNRVKPPNTNPLWTFISSTPITIYGTAIKTSIKSKKLLKLNNEIRININDVNLQEYYKEEKKRNIINKYYEEKYNLAYSNEPKANIDINQIIKKKLFLKGLKNFDYSEVYGGTSELIKAIQTKIQFINDNGIKYFKQYLEGEFINHTLNVLSNDIYSEISSICYKKERTNDGELLNYIKKVIEQTSYVVNFFVVSNYNMNRNLIAALEKNAQTNVNGTNPANYRKYIYDTQFNILDTFKKYFDEV
jgi:hypothetical protein